jgi:hypothetical protein
VSAYIALANATTNWQHGSAQCLSGKDIAGYDFLSIFKDEFVLMPIKPAFKAWLGNVVF